MIQRIEQIQGIGLLYDANGKKFPWKKATIIYGDNGRGKSTISAILRALSQGDASSILAKKTIDGTLAPNVVLQFANGHKVTFTMNSWTQTRPEINVFDSDFVEKNIFSGGAVNTGHRRNLLQFALGAKAVTASTLEGTASNNARIAADAKKDIESKLSGHHTGVTLAVFEKLPAIADIETQISDLEKRIISARSSAAILQRSVPSPIKIPELDFSEIFKVLTATINSIQNDAEELVRSQISRIGKPNAEGWLSQGQLYDDGEICPYCAQPTSQVDLIQAYRTYFNKAYADFKNQVNQLDSKLSRDMHDSLLTNFSQLIETARSTANAWTDHVEIPNITFDQSAAKTRFSEMKNMLSSLTEEKQLHPTEAIGNETQFEAIKAVWKEIQNLMSSANTGINSAKTAINEFRANLATENIQTMEGQHQNLELTKKRHSQTVIQLFDDLQKARSAVSAANTAKTEARTNLDQLMQQILGKYQTDINALLERFGASFKIENMNANFRGGAPRSEYGLAIRGKSVSLEGGPPSFETTLSEGDKRTLAFAFFVASTLADSNIGNKIVVVDDPMCSLDLTRKQHTRTVLKAICEKAEQLVVLSHDIYFARDLQIDLTPKDGSYQVSVFQLKYAANGYTGFDDIDLVHECQSPYVNHFTLLQEYVQEGTGDMGQVAKSIRPLLEGYLHRRFPGILPKDIVFGQILGQINSAVTPSPLCHAQSLVSELNEINLYAGKFHHDTNPGNADSETITPSELRNFAKRALTVIHKGYA